MEMVLQVDRSQWRDKSSSPAMFVGVFDSPWMMKFLTDAIRLPVFNEHHGHWLYTSLTLNLTECETNTFNELSNSVQGVQGNRYAVQLCYEQLATAV